MDGAALLRSPHIASVDLLRQWLRTNEIDSRSTTDTTAQVVEHIHEVDVRVVWTLIRTEIFVHVAV